MREEINAAVTRVLRGSIVSAMLRRLGIDSKRFWLLVDLFGELSERGEMLDQLGRNGVALKSAAWMYFVFSCIVALVLVVARAPLTTYFWGFQIFTAFSLLVVLLSETGNSLVNPAEGLVLAHQPISGRTYIAAKLTHLLTIVLYLVPGLDVAPALAGLLLKNATWRYPFLHLGAALATGITSALFCCAGYGWLIRFVPARRLKAAGQFAGTIPLLFVFLWQPLLRALLRSNVLHSFQVDAWLLWVIGISFGAIAIGAVAFGIRSLSVDYLLSVSSIMRGGAATGASLRRSRIGNVVSRLFGGQPARAGFAFVSRMMLRDWQFRRQLVPVFVPAVVAAAPAIIQGRHMDPFARGFTPLHFLPHMFGFVLFFICNILAYSSEYQGRWLFLLAPGVAFGRFARGVHALLWIEIILVPHFGLLLLLSWFFGLWHAALFVAYSVAVASAYLALELRLIQGAPFSRQIDTSAATNLIPLMMLGGVVIAVAVALQHLLVFRSTWLVILATSVIAAAACFLTRSSLRAFEVAIRYHIGLVSAEAGPFYKEVDA